jgi:hypothetical protein
MPERIRRRFKGEDGKQHWAEGKGRNAVTKAASNQGDGSFVVALCLSGSLLRESGGQVH